MTTILAIGLATWRLSELLGRERGPFALFTGARTLAGVTHDENGAPVTYPDNELGMGLSCDKCRSIWAALVVVLLARFGVSRWLVTALAGSAFALLASRSDLTLSQIYDAAWMLTRGSR